MNILYMPTADPRRTDYGTAMRSHLMWKALRRIGTVYTVYNVGPTDPKTVFDLDDRIASAVFLSPNPLVKVAQVLFGRLCPPAAWPFRSARFVTSRIPWKGVAFDCVVVRYLQTAALTAAWKIAPLYVDIDDLPSESFATIRRPRKGRLAGMLLQFVVNAWQRFVLRKCRGTWIANAEQAPFVSRIVPCATLPNQALEPGPGYVRNGRQKRQLMTVGLMSYEPNYQGVDWFLETCWPAISAKFPDLEYAIAGGGLSDALKVKWSALPNVRVLGFVADLDGLYAESAAVVAPILAGAGTCVKVVEAALRGRAVLATPFAVRGFDGETRRLLGFRVATIASEMVTAVAHLLDNPERAAAQDRMAEAARAYNSFDRFVKEVRDALR